MDQTPNTPITTYPSPKSFWRPKAPKSTPKLEFEELKKKFSKKHPEHVGKTKEGIEEFKSDRVLNFNYSGEKIKMDRVVIMNNPGDPEAMTINRSIRKTVPITSQLLTRFGIPNKPESQKIEVAGKIMSVKVITVSKAAKPLLNALKYISVLPGTMGDNPEKLKLAAGLLGLQYYSNNGETVLINYVPDPQNPEITPQSITPPKQLEKPNEFIFRHSTSREGKLVIEKLNPKTRQKEAFLITKTPDDYYILDHDATPRIKHPTIDRLVIWIHNELDIYL